jgi:MFS family permease
LVTVGLVLSGATGFAGAVLAGAVLNAPLWVIPLVLFGPPVLYTVALGILLARRARRHGYGGVTPEQRAAVPLVVPVVVAFLVVGGLSFAGVLVAQMLNAPGWVVPVVFFAPAVLLPLFAWPYLKALPGRLRRAAPSPERAAALARKPAPRATPLPRPADPAAFPTVPADPSTPGRHLARRLPSADVPAGCVALGVFAMAAFWNGIVSVFVWQVVQGFRNGRPEWFQVVFLIPFVLVGLALIVGFVAAVASWVISLLAGSVTVEVDDHPFRPGRTYSGHIAQTGLCRLMRVGVELTCEEAATYQAGTSESTDKKVVARHPAEPAEPNPATPLDFTVTVPADAMHSFDAAKNRIGWSVKVRGRVLGVLPYTRSYTVIVHPGDGDG